MPGGAEIAIFFVLSIYHHHHHHHHHHHSRLLNGMTERKPVH